MPFMISITSQKGLVHADGVAFRTTGTIVITTIDTFLWAFARSVRIADIRAFIITFAYPGVLAAIGALDFVTPSS